MQALGDYIHGAFVAPEGQPLVSVNPAQAGRTVLETAGSTARVEAACIAADAAQPGWARMSIEARAEALERFRLAIADQADRIADAIVWETGKLRAEAKVEVAALQSRFGLVRAQVVDAYRNSRVPGHPGEQLRHHALGVVGIIGPFNFPAHLCHAHAIPALLLGNAVVIKPSEVAPLVGQRYAEAAHAAGLPPGILNVVQGNHPVGAALVADTRVRGLCFTGSYAVGRRIREAVLDRPELLLALEMGGKNTVIVLEDADLRQAAHEIVVGGYLTTGQRCTATDRVLVHERVADELTSMLTSLVSSLRFGDPEDTTVFAGPLATRAGAQQFSAALAAAAAAGAEALVAGGVREDGWYANASLHRLPAATHTVAGYTDMELFGPDICLQSVADDDAAIAIIRDSPFGFANSVFTASSSRFDRFYYETHAGILNRNRSTNQASPRLPFGGVGRSGNYRAAGAYAARNAVYPTAIQENVLGAVQVHRLLADELAAPDLEQLSARHEVEERAEASRELLDLPRPLALRRPQGGHLPQSEYWLTRLYAGERVVREKKPAVFDHLRSAGPWFVSVDDDPLSLLDGMSQTATLCGGFAEESVVRAYFEGEFGDAVVRNVDTSAFVAHQARQYADVLRHSVPGLPEVTFANSGAEANEKALALCRLNSSKPNARRVLAFEGSFHGRTLVALHATWSPKKREPFELSGYEATFAPFPLWDEPTRDPVSAPAGFYSMVGLGETSELAAAFLNDDDPLLAAEVRSLLAVHKALSMGDYFACIIEPMQSEGGDRYATPRFFRALRLLTRHHDVALVFDEVQTGFGLGGSFAWHTDFRLVNFRGQPDFPDAVTFAKRAQVGVVMSQFADPEPTSAHVASLVRGRIHAEMVATAHAAERIEHLVAPRLDAIARAFPHLVARPRGRGYAFAFDVPSNKHLMAYLGQRFWRGAIVFGAGTRTVRYRLSQGFRGADIERLFVMIRRSLSWLDAHPGVTPPSWEDDAAAAPQPPGDVEYAISTVGPDDALALLPAILDIEYRVYEPVRRTPPAQIRTALRDPEGIVTVAEARDGNDWQLVGFGIGAPLERVADLEEGPDRDPMLGRHNTLYSLSLTVAPEHQGRGLGRAVKEAQLREARRRRSGDAPRFRFVTGRNRVGHTASMTHLNQVFGAHLVSVLTGQYADPEGQAIYYRIPLAPLGPVAPPSATANDTPGGRDISTGIAQPFAEPPASLSEALRDGGLYGPAVNKITLLNYATPAVVRAMEWVSALYPALPHMYLTSSRDEVLDKSLRILKWHRAKACVAVGFAGGYVGHTTGAARSLSDQGVHAQGPAYFRWPLLPHPADVGTEASIGALRSTVREHGPEALFGIVLEAVQERTGRVVPPAFWSALSEFRDEHDVPVVLIETASACYRSGSGPFASDSRTFVPDILGWWGGAQTGYLHVSGAMRVAVPLAMASTWDGDELSLVREHHQLRAARELNVAPAVSAYDRVAALARERGVPCAGLGLYRVLQAGDRAEAIVAALAERGLRARAFRGGGIPLAPPLDQAEVLANSVLDALGEVL